MPRPTRLPEPSWKFWPIGTGFGPMQFATKVLRTRRSWVPATANCGCSRPTGSEHPGLELAGCGEPAKTADTFRCSSKTACGEMLSALVKGESEPCQGSTGKLYCESALHLLQGGPRRLARRRADNPQRSWPGVGAAAAGAGGPISEWTARWQNRRRHPYATSVCSVFLICLVVRI